MKKKICDYYGCKGVVIKEIEVPCNNPNKNNNTTIIHMCKKCYEEYHALMSE